MAIPGVSDPANPESVSTAEFDTRRRGFDPIQVRAYLKVVSRELARLRAREAELTAALAEATATPPAPVEFDEDRATQLLGEETTRVLTAARVAASEKVARANDQAQDIVERAEAEAAEIRAGAHAAVDQELAAARADGRAIIAEAKLVRERMLDELAQKRHALRAQLDQMSAGRDRLAESYAHIRKALDDVSATLDDALPAAQVAARRAAERHAIRTVPGASSIEREIDDAARAGLPLVTQAEVDAEVAATAPTDDDETPAGWVNAGARHADDAPARDGDDLGGSDESTETGDELFGAWDDQESTFFLADPAVVVDLADAGSLDATDDRTVVVVDEVVTRTDSVVRATSVTIIDHGGAAGAENEVEPHEIVLAELTRSRRDTGLPREAVPILEPPDAVEVVRVLRDEPAPPASSMVMPQSGEPTRAAGPRVAEYAPVAEPEPDLVAVVVSEPVVEPESDLVAVVVPEPVVEPESDPVAVVVPEPVVEPDAEPEGDAAPVDDLFARIRRTRAAKVAKAEEVLRSALFPTTDAEPVDEEQHTDVEPARPAVVIAEDRVGAAQADDAAHFAARDESLVGVQTQIVRKLKRLLADEQNDVLDLVRRSRGTASVDEVMPSAADHAGRFVAAIGGELLTAVGQGASFFGDGAGAEAADFAALDACVADQVVAPLRSLIERAMSVDAGEEELLDRVRSAYRELRGQHIDSAARMLALAAFNTGVEASHPDSLVRWAVDPVHGCSPDCDDNALEGPVAVGTAFPTGVTRPPGHPDCRCLLVPVPQ